MTYRGAWMCLTGPLGFPSCQERGKYMQTASHRSLRRQVSTITSLKKTSVRLALSLLRSGHKSSLHVSRLLSISVISSSLFSSLPPFLLYFPRASPLLPFRITDSTFCSVHFALTASTVGASLLFPVTCYACFCPSAGSSCFLLLPQIENAQEPYRTKVLFLLCGKNTLFGRE